MTQLKNLFRPRPLSMAIGSALALGTASVLLVHSLPVKAQDKAGANDPLPLPLCAPGLEKAFDSDGVIALYEVGDGTLVSAPALPDAMSKCIKASTAGYSMTLAGSPFNVSGQIEYVLADRSITFDTVDRRLCESYHSGTTGYRLLVTNINNDTLGGSGLPGVASLSYNPASHQLTPTIMDATYGPWVSCYDVGSLTGSSSSSSPLFSGGFETGADVRIDYLDENDAPIADDELVTTIGTNSVYKVRISNLGSEAVQGLRIREFLPTSGVTPTVTPVSCVNAAGTPACGATVPLNVNIATLNPGEAKTYTLTRTVNSASETAVAESFVAAFINPDLTYDIKSANNARRLRNGLRNNALPVADPKSANTAEDTAVGITFSASDSDGTIVSFSVAGSPMHGSLTGSGASRTYTPAADYNGNDSFTYTATDDKGGVSAPATVTITVAAVNDKARYVAGSLPNITVSELDEVFIPLNGSFVDPESDAISYSVTGTLPGGVAYQSAPNQIYGASIPQTACNTATCNFPVTITAIDAGSGLSATRNFTITVNNVNQNPVLDSLIADQVSNEGSVIAFDVAGNFSDPDVADTLTYSKTGGTLPQGLSLASNGQITGTISQTAANSSPYSITVQASDGQGGSVSDTFSWSVNTVNVAPTAVGQIPDENRVIGVSWSIPESTLLAAFTDVDGDTLTISGVSGLPSAMQHFPGTGIAGSVSSVGNYQVTVTASDGALTANQLFTIFATS